MSLTLEDIKKCNTNSTGAEREICGLVENVKKLIDEYISSGKGRLITGDRLFDPKYGSNLEYSQKAVHEWAKRFFFAGFHDEIAQRAYFKKNDEKANWYEAIREMSFDVFSFFKNRETDSFLGIAIAAQTIPT